MSLLLHKRHSLNKREKASIAEVSFLAERAPLVISLDALDGDQFWTSWFENDQQYKKPSFFDVFKFL